MAISQAAASPALQLGQAEGFQLVAGTDDPIVPVVNARIMNRLMPHSRLHLHAGGHIDLVTNAPELAPVIVSFLRNPGVNP